MNIGFQTSGLSGFTRVAYLWRRHASAVLWIAMAALLPTACSDDAEQSVPQANGHTAVIYLNFKTGASKQAAEMNTSQSSETRAPLTRAIDENGINTVDVLSFKVDPADPTNIKKGTFFYRAQGTYDIGTQTVRVQLMGAPEHQTLVVLANVREQVNTLAAAFGEQKEGGNEPPGIRCRNGCRTRLYEWHTHVGRASQPSGGRRFLSLWRSPRGDDDTCDS